MARCAFAAACPLRACALGEFAPRACGTQRRAPLPTPPQCDVQGNSERPANCNVALAMDVPAFWGLMIAALEAAGDASRHK